MIRVDHRKYLALWDRAVGMPNYDKRIWNEVSEQILRANSDAPPEPFQTPIDKKYQDDPEFRMLVDVMTHELGNGRFTPTELRQAAMCAAIHYEYTHIRPQILDPSNFSIEDKVVTDLKLAQHGADNPDYKPRPKW